MKVAQPFPAAPSRDGNKASSSLSVSLAPGSRTDRSTFTAGEMRKETSPREKNHFSFSNDFETDGRPEQSTVADCPQDRPFV